jgi:hypothetical protein
MNVDDYCFSHAAYLDRIAERQRLLAEAIEAMREFSNSEEIADTLRYAADVLEGRER